MPDILQNLLFLAASHGMSSDLHALQHQHTLFMSTAQNFTEPHWTFHSDDPASPPLQSCPLLEQVQRSTDDMQTTTQPFWFRNILPGLLNIMALQMQRWVQMQGCPG